MQITLETTLVDVLQYQHRAIDDSYQSIINMLMNNMPSRIVRPQEPKLKSLKPTLEEMETYKKELLVYPSSLEQYKIDNEKYVVLFNHIHQLIVDFIKEDTKFNEYVPENKKEMVWSKACDSNDDGGFTNLYREVENLVDLYS